MEHNQPRHRVRRGNSNNYQQSIQSSAARYPLEDDSPRTVYVSNLTNDITNEALFDAFNQYGTVESIMRRSVSFELCAGSGQQYAFVRYRAVKDARFVINLGDITVQGRKLSVRPRDKPMMSPTSSRGSKSYYANGGARIMEMLQKGENPQQMAAQQYAAPDAAIVRHAPVPGIPHISHATPVSMEQIAQSSLNNRILTVANIPADMPPMDLYTLFKRFGNVEGSYIFPHPDPFGRRFGQIAMATPYDAQKAFENLNGMSVNGSYPLEITNRSTIMFNMPATPVPVPPIGSAGFALPPYAIAHGAGQFIPPVSIPQPQMQQMPPDMRQWNEAMAMHGHGGAIQHNMAEIMAAQQLGMGMLPPYGFDPEAAGLTTMGPASMQHEFDSSRNPNVPRAISGSSSATLVSSNLERNARQMMAMDAYQQQPVRYMVHPDQQSVSQQYNIQPPKGQQFGFGKLDMSETDAEHQTRDGDSQVANPSSTTGPQYIPETTKPYDPANLYVKNLDDQCIINTEDLKNLFVSHGQITSAFLATYPSSGISKGFGFVAFASPQDATKAKAALDGRVVGRKRIFITYAERKEDRIQRLKAIFEGRGTEGSSPSTPASQSAQASKPNEGSSERTFEEIVKEKLASSEEKKRAEAAASENINHTATTTNREEGKSEQAELPNDCANEMKASSGESIVDTTSGGESGQTTPSEEKEEASFSSGDAGGSFESDGSSQPFERKVTVTTTVTTTKAWSRPHGLDEDSRSSKDQTLQSHANLKEHSRHPSLTGRNSKQSQDARYHGADRDMPQPLAAPHYHGSFVGNPSIIPFTGPTQQQRPNAPTNASFFKERRSRNWRTQNRLSNGGEARFARGSPDREWVEHTVINSGSGADVNRFGFQQTGYQHSRAFEGSKQGDNANSQGPANGPPGQRKKWKNRGSYANRGNGPQEGGTEGHQGSGANANANGEKKSRAPKRPPYSNRNSSNGVPKHEPAAVQSQAQTSGTVDGSQAKPAFNTAYPA